MCANDCVSTGATRCASNRETWSYADARWNNKQRKRHRITDNELCTSSGAHSTTGRQFRSTLEIPWGTHAHIHAWPQGVIDVRVSMAKFFAEHTAACGCQLSCAFVSGSRATNARAWISVDSKFRRYTAGTELTPSTEFINWFIRNLDTCDPLLSSTAPRTSNKKPSDAKRNTAQPNEQYIRGMNIAATRWAGDREIIKWWNYNNKYVVMNKYPALHIFQPPRSFHFIYLFIIFSLRLSVYASFLVRFLRAYSISSLRFSLWCFFFVPRADRKCCRGSCGWAENKRMIRIRRFGTNGMNKPSASGAIAKYHRVHRGYALFFWQNGDI